MNNNEKIIIYKDDTQTIEVLKILHIFLSYKRGYFMIDQDLANSLIEYGMASIQDFLAGQNEISAIKYCSIVPLLKNKRLFNLFEKNEKDNDFSYVNTMLNTLCNTQFTHKEMIQQLNQFYGEGNFLIKILPQKVECVDGIIFLKKDECLFILLFGYDEIF